MTEQRKIIVDEDWKAQVEAEREAIRQQEAEKQSEQQQSGTAAGNAVPDEQFPLLVSMLGTQAMMSLGQIQNPITNKAETDLNQAKQFIDLLGVLETKTKGNLTAEESKMLSNLLHELRMMYVHVSQKNRQPQDQANS